MALERLLRELTALRSGVPLIFEIGFDQADWAKKLASSSTFALREIRPDYAGIHRVVVLRRR